MEESRCHDSQVSMPVQKYLKLRTVSGYVLANLTVY